MRFGLPQASAEAESKVLFLRVPGGRYPASQEVPLRFVETAGHIEILAPREPPPHWARALIGRMPVSWRIGNRRREGMAERVQEPAAVEAILGRFESSFGRQEVTGWFGGAVLAFRLQEAASSPEDYHAAVAAYFDGLAPQYDLVVGSNPLDFHLRSISGNILLRAFARSGRVLEIGCGTGLETLPLARRGVHMVATDISGAMLDQLSEKAVSEGLMANIETRQLGAHDLQRVLDEFGPESFDGGFSDFGALNCEPEWGTLPKILHQLIRSKGILILGIWNRYCAAEALLSVAAGEPRRAFARFEDPVAVGRSRYGIPVFARGPGEVLAMLRPYFEPVRLTGIPVFVPPYDFDGGLRSRDGLLSLLRGFDARLADKFPFNRIGDHFLAELRRRP